MKEFTEVEIAILRHIAEGTETPYTSFVTRKMLAEYLLEKIDQEVATGANQV